jgi:hypothetical protein
MWTLLISDMLYYQLIYCPILSDSYILVQNLNPQSHYILGQSEYSVTKARQGLVIFDFT